MDCIVHRVANRWTLTDFYFDFELSCSSNGKESLCDARVKGSIPGWGSSSGEGNGNPFQYYCLENSMDREAWRATVHGVSKREPIST